MDNNIYMQRHEKQHNCYISEVMGGDGLFAVVCQVEDYEDSGYIWRRLMKKSLFAFSLMYESRVMGWLCLDDIDWENRNGRIKGGIRKEFNREVYAGALIIYLEQLLRFCAEELRLKRVWTIVHDNDVLGLKVASALLELEGAASENDILYFGRILR